MENKGKSPPEYATLGAKCTRKNSQQATFCYRRVSEPWQTRLLSLGFLGFFFPMSLIENREEVAKVDTMSIIKNYLEVENWKRSVQYYVNPHMILYLEGCRNY